MPRFACRRFVVLWWVLLALLPLRAWAGVVMHLPAAPAATMPADAAPPCHGHAVGGIAHDDGAGDGAAALDGDAACTLCDLCHGSAAVIAVPSFEAAPPSAQALPAAAPPPMRQADPSPPYRPPRG